MHRALRGTPVTGGEPVPLAAGEAVYRVGMLSLDEVSGTFDVSTDDRRDGATLQGPLYPTGHGGTRTNFKSLKESGGDRRSAGNAGIGVIAPKGGRDGPAPLTDATFAANGGNAPVGVIASIATYQGNAPFAPNASIGTEKPLATFTGICDVAPRVVRDAPARAPRMAG